jgi:DNA-binding NarL/FixJ family response regulator
MNRITVLLAEDHAMVREGLRALLAAEADIEVVGEAGDGRQAVALVGKLRPSVVVMDIAMPLLNGLEATRQVLRASPTTKVLALSAHSDDAYVERAMALGASGYLVKQSAGDLLAKAIREIHQGKPFYSPSISRRLHRQPPEPAPGAKGKRRGLGAAPRLSPREAEVLQLIAEGKANKETAAELGISIKTVEKHRQSLMAKLGIHDTAGLTRHAIATGIIESSVHVTIL